MRRMRRVVKHYNIYRWAANLIGAASEIRLDPIKRTKAAVAQSDASTTVRSFI
jgi:hypothetical protein